MSRVKYTNSTIYIAPRPHNIVLTHPRNSISDFVTDGQDQEALTVGSSSVHYGKVNAGCAAAFKSVFTVTSGFLGIALRGWLLLLLLLVVVEEKRTHGHTRRCWLSPSTVLFTSSRDGWAGTPRTNSAQARPASKSHSCCKIVKWLYCP